MYGVDTIVRIFCHFVFIYMAFWALQSTRLDVLFKKGEQNIKKMRIIFLLMAILLGYNASNFFMEVIFLTRDLLFGYLT